MTLLHLRKVGLLFCAFSLFVLSLCPTLLAKDKKREKERKSKAADYALVKGSVFREDGFSVRGVRVVCRRANESKPRWEAVTGEAGEFAFRLPIGKMQYVISTGAEGFESVPKTVTIENEERQDISLILKFKKP